MFSERLKSLRNRKGLTQGELAEKLCISRSALSLYELGKREPDFDTLCLIAKYFRVSVDYILGNEEVSTLKGTDRDIVYEKESNNSLTKEIENLSSDSKAELKKYIQLLKLKDTMDKSKDEMSSPLMPNVSKNK